jgi:hypothetical protein
VWHLSRLLHGVGTVLLRMVIHLPHPLDTRDWPMGAGMVDLPRKADQVRASGAFSLSFNPQYSFSGFVAFYHSRVSGIKGVLGLWLGCDLPCLNHVY